ncbi:THUMP domain-containing class I SAM-dependent RNA methyltransferase [Leptothoe kymatousa]|uniref:Class I SAM-dependent RNA methyltransferase n=1 Tax=Leptothoe kymatousa TAU-MAC 1615 TaxID=2364775 RepID=A0ABS5Y3Q3_9CYAN|nr:class I SAM-dependent RNA methyltransferase [Leptothoe kymatousa]MBT9312446.1 class I SAM-dependent RNA methyltransferase [Leptothoe kymatousa TAU-MAC 1615]
MLFNCFATVARGLEELAANELERLGADGVEPGFCGVGFRCDRTQLYKINLWARLPFRILVTVGKVGARDRDSLYYGIQSIDWDIYFSPDYSIAVKATGKNQRLNHSHFTALQVKNAIVDQQQDRHGGRSGVDTESPDVQINVHIDNNQAVVSLDSSGSSLHRRGYRPAMGVAPLKESLAAALVSLTEWSGDIAFLDPMCGSGTLPIEASLQALNIAPGLFRQQSGQQFGFQTWPDYKEPLWQSLVAEAEQQQRAELTGPVLGCDRDLEVLDQARTNASHSGVDNYIDFSYTDFADIEAPADSGILICNPPYGERLGQSENLAPFYKLMGDILKQRFKGWTAYILSGNKALTKRIGLRTARKIPVYNGAIPCQFLKYELY